jgi:hypothetical protein
MFKRRRFPVEIILLCVRWYPAQRSTPNQPLLKTSHTLRRSPESHGDVQVGSGADLRRMEWDAIKVQDESVGFVQGTSFRSRNHCALRALVSRIQIEFSGLGPNVRRLVPEVDTRFYSLTDPAHPYLTRAMRTPNGSSTRWSRGSIFSLVAGDA